MFDLLRDSINTVKDTSAGPPGFGDRFSTFSNVLAFFANVVIIVAAAYSFFTIMLAFYNLITSGSSPDKVKKNTSGILWGIFGLLISVSAYVLKNIVFEGAGVADEISNPTNF